MLGNIRIGYYKCLSKCPRNAEYIIHVLYDHTHAWERSSINKRALDFVVDRAAHPHEIEAVDNQKRAISFKYRSFDGLIEDEINADTDEQFIMQLREAFSAII